MADKSAIEWTDATWNPIVGCSIHSPGCANCYAMKMAARMERMFAGTTGAPHYRGLTQPSKAGPVFTGKVAQAPDQILTQPLRWKRGRKIFVNSMGDLFHENVPDEWIDKVFAVMALCPQHTFQVLTKRAERMRAYFSRAGLLNTINGHKWSLLGTPRGSKIEHGGRWMTPALPLPNVWLGVSTERQQEADERIPHLLATPAAVRFISAEPLLGPLNIRQWIGDWGCGCGYGGDQTADHCPNCGWVGEGPTIEFECGDSPGNCPECKSPLSDYYACPECNGTGQDGSGFGPNSERLDWVIVGGESGHGARPMHPDWARSLRDQCAAAGVPFFFKQWGAWQPNETARDRMIIGADGDVDIPDDRTADEDAGEVEMAHVGKKAAGRLLDGKEHNEFPSSNLPMGRRGEGEGKERGRRGEG